ncbi:FtsX-like permease family protein [Pseudolysobacter antarcticus]|uniref:FtsX-like permease family protein n=1 Tax=Pseudolysobacter antarcticus TaxID=2511995 RepID=A0A411HF56_9GAMM|nr:ADOP family duplicated permease [Pseudolysobacter antarcticus]QBB69112.1 FtsX-like permease family protein [Pseudolysobacter antarcticus]
MNICWTELKHAARGIATRPAFSALVIGVLAAGLTCVIFMLAMINGFVRPPPFNAPDQLLKAGLVEKNGHEQFNNADLSVGNDNDFLQIRRQLKGIAEVASYTTAVIRLSDLDRPEVVEGGINTTNLFHVFGVAPMLGRDFVDDDGREGSPAVAMLSYRLWQSRYGGDPAIIERQIRVDSHAANIIGVMPENYGYPGKEALWIPAVLGEGKNLVAADWGMKIVLRRMPGIDDAAIQNALDSWFADAVRAEPHRLQNQHAVIAAFTHYSPRERLFFTLAFVAVMLVLLVACANAANLLLTRTLARRQELGVRIALGASRSRIVLQLLMQSLLLSLIAAAIAVPLAVIGAVWQESTWLQSDAHAPWQHFSLDSSSVLFAIGATLISALLCGLLPALHASNTLTAGPLRDAAPSVVGGSFARVSRILVIGEIALSCVLLISVGTMLRAITAVEHAHLGIDEQHLLSAKFDLTKSTYPSNNDQLRLYEKLTQRLRDDANVVDASVGQIQPGVWSDTLDVAPDSAPIGDHVLPPMYYGAVDDHSLSTFGIHLQEGRFFDSRDRADSEQVAVVDRRFVERLGDGASVLGKRFRIDSSDPSMRTVTVVGVVETLTLTTPQEPKFPSMLVPLRQAPNVYGIVTVRTRGNAKSYTPRLTEIMHGIDPDIPLYGVGDYAKYNHRNTTNERQTLQWFAISGLIALLIASAGLYGVMAFSVGQRTREIGVRRALGAPQWRILRSVFARAAAQVGIGLALGLGMGIPFARMLTRYSQTVAVHDPLMVLGVLCMLLLTAAFAVIVPARRALRVDPMIALRHE